ncbi:MAG TPA: M3 family metallopeptidase [Elusimicrobiota bacterium]|nr:M3 family metallopeptidase [Elusimicrobiota bacterium]
MKTAPLFAALLLAASNALAAKHHKTREIEAKQQEASAAPAAPFTPHEGLRFDLTPAELTQDCVDAKKRAESALAQIASLPATARTFDNTPWALDRALADLGDQTAADVFLEQVAVSSSVRDAGNACDVLLSQFNVDAYAREDLYRAMKDYASKKEPLKGENARLLEKTLLDFRRSGLDLPPATRDQVTALHKTLAKLQADFDKNINESNDYALLSKEQLDGVPDEAVAKLERDGDKYKVGVDYPTFYAVENNARDPEARRLLEAKFDDRAARLNMPLFSEVLKLRLKAAHLLGYATHADYAVEENMAKDPKTVNAFLARLRTELRPLGQEEREVLVALKRAMEGRASDGVLHAWDFRYYDNLLKATKYRVDEDQVREYFPADLVVDRMLDFYQKLLGVKFRQVPGAVTWHPDVKLFEITDASGGAPIGYFYMDLYPREGKYSHAAAFPLIAARRLTDGSYQKPVAAIVANLDKPSADRPSLLSHDGSNADEVETIFHEFGHIMHMTLTKAEFSRFSGSNVARDFVEAPSQMLENFVWDPGVLESISGHYKDHSKKLPKDLMDKMIAARRVDVALWNLRQLLFGTFDMACHGKNPPADSTKLYARVMQDVSLIPMSEGTHPEASFAHIIGGGYDAGYYGYLWSLVYAQDMFSEFKAAGVMSPEVGRRYRTEILEKGSARDEMDSLKAFLGRKPSEDAFLESIGLGKPPKAS